MGRVVGGHRSHLASIAAASPARTNRRYRALLPARTRRLAGPPPRPRPCLGAAFFRDM